MQCGHLEQEVFVVTSLELNLFLLQSVLFPRILCFQNEHFCESHILVVVTASTKNDSNPDLFVLSHSCTFLLDKHINI